MDNRRMFFLLFLLFPHFLAQTVRSQNLRFFPRNSDKIGLYRSIRFHNKDISFLPHFVQKTILCTFSFLFHWQIVSIKFIILAVCHNVNMNKDSLAQSLLLKDRIAELRKEKGLSQVALAKQLDVDSSTIAKYETGDRFPDVIMLMKLADFFDVSVDYIIGRKNF